MGRTCLESWALVRKFGQPGKPERTGPFKNYTSSTTRLSGPIYIQPGVFFFFIFLKIKISKIYVRLNIFQKYPRSPLQRATGPKCNFFSLNLQRCPWKKKEACRPPKSDRGGLSPPPLGRPLGPAHGRSRGACRPPRERQGGLSPPHGRQGPVAHPRGDRGLSPVGGRQGLLCPI